MAGGKGAYAALDPVAGPFAEKLTQSVRDGGTYLLYSRLGGMTAHVGIEDLLYRGVTVRSPCAPSTALCHWCEEAVFTSFDARGLNPSGPRQTLLLMGIRDCRASGFVAI